MSVRFYLFLLISLTLPSVQARSINDIDSNPVHWLLSQIAIGEMQRNNELVRDSLHKLTAIAPQRVETLCAQASYNISHDNLANASDILKKLSSTSHPCVEKLTRLFAAKTTDRARIERAKQFALKGNYENASALYEKIFHGLYPALEYELTHLDWYAQDLKNWSAVNKAYTQLRSLYPNIGQIELAYARHLLRKQPSNNVALQLLKQYSLSSRYANEVEEIWLSALKNMPLNNDTYLQFQHYLRLYPFSSIGKQQFQQFQTALQAEERLLADPAYQSWLKGDKLLSQNKLKAAEPLLLTALKGRPQDSNVLQSIGLLYLKLNNNAKALLYFTQAQQFTGVVTQLDTLQELASTAKFWLYIEQAKQAINQGDFAKAQLKLNLASTLNRQPIVILYNQSILYEAQGKYTLAENTLHAILTTEPLNKTALIALLNIVKRDNNEQPMVRYFNQLNGAQKQLIASQYYLALASSLRGQARQLIKQSKTEHAISKLKYSINNAPEQAWPYYDLALIYQQQGLTNQAFDLLKRAYDKYNGNATFHYTYALYLNAIDDYQGALTSLKSLPKSQYNDEISALAYQLKITILFLETDELINSKDKGQVIYQLSFLESQKLTPVLQAKLARIWHQIEEQIHAITLLNKALVAQPTLSSFWHNLYGRWLLESEDKNKTQNWFEQYTLAQSANAQEVEQYIQLANDYYTNYYHGSELIAKLNQLDHQFKSNVLTATALINANLALQHNETAVILYQTKVQNNLQFNAQTKVEVAKAHLELGNQAQAKKLLSDVVSQSTTEPDYFQHQVMRTLSALDEASDAMTLAQQLIDKSPKDQELIYLATQVAERYDNEAQASVWYLQALSPQSVLTDEQLYNELIAINENDPWYINNTKQAIIARSKKNQAYISLGLNLSNRSNSENELTTDTGVIPIEAYFPLWQGQAFVKIDPTQVSAQTSYFDQQTSGSLYGQGALCIYTCTKNEITPTQSGIDIGIGWQNEYWRIDVGKTPLGFLVEDTVWGVQYTDTFADINWQVALEKRPVTDSVLSYAGLKDINSDNVWGGVRATGVTLNGSLNLTEDWGLWSSADLQLLTGQNVKDNQRYRIMGGAYYHIIKNQQRELTVGTNLLHWAYQYNLSEQTYGHGGYYSPQNYMGLSIPFTYDARWGNDAVYRLRADIGLSTSNTHSSDYFPNDPHLQASALLRESDTNVNPVYEATSASGIAYLLEGSLEYRLTPQWFMGGYFKLEQADYYEPASAQLYIRYYFDSVFGALPFPPKSVTPYSDF
jgi:hypothetical protein